MKLEQNEITSMNDFFSMIRQESEKIETENGDIKFLVSNDILEEMEYRMYLINAIAEGDWSYENEPTSSLEEFEKKFGISEWKNI